MNSNIRTEIQGLIDKLPEDSLQPILDYLRQVEKTGRGERETTQLVKKIFDEDVGLLKRLAE